MENERKIYTQAETVTGRVIGVVADEQHGLFKIVYVDGKGGALPTSLSGRFTGVKFAEHALNSFIVQTHKIAAEHTAKQRKPNKGEETVVTL